jgi:hypothetical protein
MKTKADGKKYLLVGILSLANRLGLGAGICIGNIIGYIDHKPG